jgi:GTP-binding protein
VTGAAEARDRIAHQLNREVLAISAVTGQGIPQLIHQIVVMLRAQREQNPLTEPLSVPILAAAASATGA